MTQNYQSGYARQWKSSVNSLWTNAVIICICSILPTLLLLFASLGKNPQLIEIFAILIPICGLVAYITNWIMVTNLESWELCASGQMQKYIGHFRRGIKIPLVCSVVMIIFGIISLIASSIPHFDIITLVFVLCIVIALLVGIVYLFIGGFGLAFGHDIEKNVSSGAKLILLSWGLYILIYIISLLMMDKINTQDIEDIGSELLVASNIINILGIIPPIVQLIGWRRIRNSELPADAE